jgi:hypothetical protein
MKKKKKKKINSGTHFQEIKALVHMIFKLETGLQKTQDQTLYPPPKLVLKLKLFENNYFRIKTTPTELRAARLARLRAAERPAARRAAKVKV